MTNKSYVFGDNKLNELFKFDLNDEVEIKLNSMYKVVAPLGKGAFSRVISMIEKQSGILWAVKILEKERFS